jgi:membrane-bound ClpP family serine protease
MAELSGLYLEFSHPGIGFAGIGGICLLLTLIAFQVLPALHGLMMKVHKAAER